MSFKKPRVLIALAVGTVGAAVALAALRSRSSGGGSRSAQLQRGALRFPAGEDPYEATMTALELIRRGAITSVGELVHLLRGTAAVTSEGEKYPNGQHHRVSFSYFLYLQESYLPGTKSDPVTVERCMLAQLAAADAAIRRLDRERATAFDPNDRAHLNLLQQLWVASGKPQSSYSRISAHWKALGFQSDDAVTDLRGGGVLALRHLVHFAQTHSGALAEMMAFNESVQSAGEHHWYLLAVVSIQFTAQLQLQSDYMLYPVHLEVIYDTVRQTAAGASSAKAVPRRQLLRQEATPEVGWQKVESDAELGMMTLHHALLLHFKKCWERDQPHVMEYNVFLEKTVLPSFFNANWSLAS